jgi:hypothetical protein
MECFRTGNTHDYAKVLDAVEKLVPYFVLGPPECGFLRGARADFLAYEIYRKESLEHGHAASAIEKSSYVADTPLIANIYPGQLVSQKGPIFYRIPISREVLQSHKDDLFAKEATGLHRPGLKHPLMRRCQSRIRPILLNGPSRKS